MKAKYNQYAQTWEVIEGMDRFTGTGEALPSSRVLEGSGDDGYDSEYIESGTIDGVPVKAIYLFTDDDMCNEDGEPYDDESNYDWDAALARIEVLIDELTDTQYHTLTQTGELAIKKLSELA